MNNKSNRLCSIAYSSLLIGYALRSQLILYLPHYPISHAVRDQFMANLSFELIHYAVRGELIKEFFKEKS